MRKITHINGERISQDGYSLWLKKREKAMREDLTPLFKFALKVMIAFSVIGFLFS